MSPLLFLYRSCLSPAQHVWSSFVVKLEVCLRFTHLAYACKVGSTKSGKGKIPDIEVASIDAHAHVRTALGDSTHIFKELLARDVLPNLNARLKPAQWTQDQALRAFLEEKSYFCHTREQRIDNYDTMRDRILSIPPALVRVNLALLNYCKISATLHGQETGRYTVDEIQCIRSGLCGSRELFAIFGFPGRRKWGNGVIGLL